MYVFLQDITYPIIQYHETLVAPVGMTTFIGLSLVRTYPIIQYHETLVAPVGMTTLIGLSLV